MSMNRNEERSLIGAAPAPVNSRHGAMLLVSLGSSDARGRNRKGRRSSREESDSQRKQSESNQTLTRGVSQSLEFTDRV